MSALLLGSEEIATIKTAVDRARARPIPWALLKAALPENQNTDVVTLADRAAVEIYRPPAEEVFLPANYRLCVSFEEQPAGLCMHCSLSVNRPGRLPHPAAASAVMQLCLNAVGQPELRDGRDWIEEFLIDGEPGGLAYNALFIVTPSQAGHA
jgi:hypothetical protein